MYNPNTLDEYLDLLDQVMFETDELIESVGFDEVGEFEPFLPVYEQLAKQLEGLHAKIRAGEHQFADGSDLAFMELVQKHKRVIPFHTLLEALNSIHKKGFK